MTDFGRGMAKITVRSGTQTRTLQGAQGETLLRLLTRHGVFLPARCGGRGTCKKCRVKLLSGSVEGASPDEEGCILACRARIAGDCTIEAESERGTGLEDFCFARRAQGRGEGLGAALDLGTTTLALLLADRSSGKVLAKESCLNPEAAFGSDVLSRIKACEDKKAVFEQQALVLVKTRELIERALAGRNETLTRLVVTGNPTMLHLFAGVDPTPIGSAPFTPVFLQERVFAGSELALPANEVLLLPSVSSYIGADVTADILAADLCSSKENVLLADLGTNGEMVLFSDGNLYAASTAAGPALEGACIECGTGGVEGAISRVRRTEQGFALETIGGAPPKGIAGSGLVDAVACLLRSGELDETGRLAKERVFFSPDVYLTQGDIRAFQLAKGAIRAGMRALLRHAGLREEELSRLLIAGGLGYHIDRASAATTGLIPPAWETRTHAVGNGSLYGGYLALLDEGCRAECGKIAARCKTLDLAADPAFSDDFMDGMLFE